MNSVRNTRVVMVLAACAGVAAGWPRTLAQDAGAGASGPSNEPAGSAALQPEAQPVFRGTQTELRTYTARSLLRLAGMEARLKITPTADDQRLAMALVEIARELDPSGIDPVRAMIALSGELGDSAKVAAATRRLVELDPKNTVAQLAMIVGRIANLQTGEERLAAYERFLGPAGATLDTSIRSRLAFEACRVRHERGEIADAARLLKQALTLDPTNKDAAVFAVEFFTERVDDAAGRFDLLTNLLLADPADVRTLATMAEQCAGVGVFGEARRFANNARLINAGLGQREETSDIVRTTVLDWALDGPGKVITDLNKVLSDNRLSAALTIKAMEEQLIPTSGIPKPDEITLDPLLERVRVFAALESGDEATIASATDNIVRSLDALLKDLQSIVDGVPGTIPPEQAAERLRKLRADLASTLYWLQRQPERAAAEMEALAKDDGVEPSDPWIVTARAWKLIREGKPSEAAAALGPVSADYTLADVGLATAYEQAGDKESAVARWRDIARDIPLSPDAGWARARLTALTGSAVPDPANAAKVRKAAALVPRWTDEIATNPRRFLSMRAELVNPDAGRLEPLKIRVVIRNEAPVALGIGPGRTISANVVIDEKAEANIEQLFGALGGEFADIARQFSLAPNQQLVVEEWAEPGFVGWMVESSAHRTIRVRWRTLYGFVRDDNGVPVPGPMGLTAETRAVARAAVPEGTLGVAALGERVRSAPEGELAAAILAVRSRLLDRDAPITAPKGPPAFRGVDPPRPPVRPTSTMLTPEERGGLASACAARYPSSSREARMMMVMSLPHELQCAEMKEFDALVRQEKDPDVAAVVIVTRVRDGADPMLAWAAGAGNPRLAQVAGAHAGAIAAGAKLWASAGPGLYGVITGVVPETPADQPGGQPGVPAPGTQPAPQPAGQPATPPAGNK
ncbi:MAG: hypothetical protein JNL50_05090 [Phycisphaerae bacterium]|nr:hypothetical protein [Phycisphaerae bacterium]